MHIYIYRERERERERYTLNNETFKGPLEGVKETVCGIAGPESVGRTVVSNSLP